MKTISLHKYTGSFAENKDVARDIRTQQIMPAIESKQQIVLDFAQVDAATQSFIHALISEVLRSKESQILEHIEFKNCTPTVKKIIEIVVAYMQERDY